MKNALVKDRYVRNGLLVCLGLIGFFFLMKVFGLIHNFELRMLNGVFMFGGVFASIKYYKDRMGENFRSLLGLMNGLKTVAVAAISFSVFVAIYLAASPDFMNAVRINEPQGQYMNPFTVSLLIFIEAMASGALFSYICMQYFKVNNQVTADGNLAVEGK